MAPRTYFSQCLTNKGLTFFLGSGGTPTVKCGQRRGRMCMRSEKKRRGGEGGVGSGVCGAVTIPILPLLLLQIHRWGKQDGRRGGRKGETRRSVGIILYRSKQEWRRRDTRSLIGRRESIVYHLYVTPHAFFLCHSATSFMMFALMVVMFFTRF